MEMQDILPLAAVDAIIWSFTSFAVVVTILRLHTRIFIVKAFGLDDGLIIAGQVNDILFESMKFHGQMMSCSQITILS